MLRFISIVFVLLALFLPTTVLAHVDGVSVFTINGSKTEIYEQDTSFNAEKIPLDSDIAPEVYNVGQQLEFALDTSKFPTGDDIFQKTTFVWDFGDSTEKQSIQYGRTNTHTYTKPGRYMLTVTADYSTAGFTSIPPQMLQVVFITVTDETQEQKERSSLPLLPIGIGLLLLAPLVLFTQKQKTRRKSSGKKK